jgi:PmbA protein
MLSPQEALDRAQDLADRARKAGADAADAVFGASSSEGIQVRLGNLEDVERSESEHISLRVFVGRRSASIGSSDLSPQALDELAARALSMAKAAPEDAFAGLAPEDLLTRAPWPELDLLDPAEPSPQALRAAALEAEEAARAIAGVSNSDGATASAGSGVFALATSHGFAGAYGSTSHSVSVSIVAGEGSAKQRDYAWRSAHHREDLPPPAEIGALAGERAVARLNPGRRSSFLLDRLEEQIFAPGIVLVEEPHTRRGLRSRPFDGEGLATRTRNLVEDGRLTGWLLDSASARQLGLAPTGHAARGGGGAPGVSVGNLHLQPGTATPEALMADIEDGVYITELIGHGVNGVTGDYSRGASGFRIVGGQIAGPIAEFTVAGNLLAMFAGLSAANDLEWHRAINVPTLRVDGMTIAGD